MKRNAWKSFLSKLKPKKPKPETVYDILSELAMTAGFLLFAYGIYMIYPAAAFIIGGALLFAFGFPAARIFKRKVK
jgi:divalent metal cation (Fe/Co/Zn/Cd) transporter